MIGWILLVAGICACAMAALFLMGAGKVITEGDEEKAFGALIIAALSFTGAMALMFGAGFAFGGTA